MSRTALCALALMFLSCSSVFPFLGTGQLQDELLRVRVLDPNGKPARDLEVLKSWRSVKGSGGCVEFRTDVRGEVSIPVTPEDCRASEQGTSYEIIARGPFGVASTRSFDPRSSARTPIELRISLRTGQLELRVQDDQGKLVQEPMEISYWCVGRTREDGTGSVPVPSVRMCETATGLAPGQTVALGCRWRILVKSADRSREPGFTEVDGPQEAGETVTRAVRTGAELPMAILHLRDPQGRPLPPQVWRCEVRTPDRAMIHRSVSSDASGTLRIVLERGVSEVVVNGIALFAASEQGAWSVEHTIGGKRIDRHVDLGEIVCHAPSSGIRGIVVDGAGVPLGWARIHVYDQDQMGAGEQNPVPLAEASTDELGRFDIPVSDAVGRIVIQVEQEDCLPLLERGIERRDPRRGDLRLVMQRAGWIEGRLIVDRQEDLDRWAIVLEDADGILQVIASSFVDSSFVLPGLDPAKRYTLHCGVTALEVGPQEHAPGHKRLRAIGVRDLDAALSFRDLRVPSGGGACTDPRIRQLDLRGLRVLCSATFRGAGNRVLADAHVTIVQREATGGTRSIPRLTDSRGRCEWLSRRNGIELFAYTDEHALARLDASAVEQEVQMVPRRLEVEVRLESAKVDNGWNRDAVHFIVVPKQLTPLWVAAIHDRQIEVNTHLDAGVARFSLPAPGRYELLLAPCRGPDQLQCSPLHPQTFCGEIEVAEREGLQSFRAVRQGLR